MVVIVVSAAAAQGRKPASANAAHAIFDLILFLCSADPGRAFRGVRSGVSSESPILRAVDAEGVRAVNVSITGPEPLNFLPRTAVRL
jgi:hypothetical protein